MKGISPVYAHLAVSIVEKRPIGGDTPHAATPEEAKPRQGSSNGGKGGAEDDDALCDFVNGHL